MKAPQTAPQIAPSAASTPPAGGRKPSAGALLGLTLAGLVPGFFLALGLSAVLAPSAPTGAAIDGLYQLAMWSITPFWMAVLCLIFVIRAPARAWLGLALANAVVWAAVLAFRG